MIVRELIAKFGFDVDEGAIRKADAGMKRLDKGAKKATNQIRQFGAGFSSGVKDALIAIGGFALIRKMKRLTTEVIKLASDSEETFSKFDTVFKDVKSEADEVATNLKKNFGLSGLAAKQLLSDTGDLLTGFGFTGDMALKLSEEVNKLAVDLASFTNFQGGATGASQALTKALLGERESIKSLGISILEEDVKKQMQIDRSKGLRFETERQAKAFATLTLAQKQSQNAIGDYARTSGSFANRMREFEARIQDLKIELGKGLLPVATEVVTELTKFLDFESGEGLKKQDIKDIAEALGLVARTLLRITKGWIAMKRLAVESIGEAVLFFQKKIGESGGISGFISKMFSDAAESFKSLFSQAIGIVKSDFVNAFSIIRNKVIGDLSAVASAVLKVTNPLGEIIGSNKRVIDNINKLQGSTQPSIPAGRPAASAPSGGNVQTTNNNVTLAPKVDVKVSDKEEFVRVMNQMFGTWLRQANNATGVG